MGKGTVQAGFDFLPLTVNIFRFSRTVLPAIQGTETKQAVHFFHSLMAGIILAVSIFKITV